MGLLGHLFLRIDVVVVKLYLSYERSVTNSSKHWLEIFLNAVNNKRIVLVANCEQISLLSETFFVAES